MRASVGDFRANRTRRVVPDNISRNPRGTNHAHSMAATLEARITTGEAQGKQEDILLENHDD
jgi:hypothetical protein